MAEVQSVNLDQCAPYEPGEFVIDDIKAAETKAPALVPGIMNVVGVGFVYIPQTHAEGSKHVVIKKFSLEDNLAGTPAPVTDLLLDFQDGNYEARVAVREPFRVQRDFEMAVTLEADREGVDGGFLRVLFFYDHEEPS
ncbi:hypothetical protein [Roseibium sp.]|uniref:hypothetical protein n=1 Tax=Roseibium sp. TaxID=1936156 RepID=UPI003BA91E1A